MNEDRLTSSQAEKVVGFAVAHHLTNACSRPVSEAEVGCQWLLLPGTYSLPSIVLPRF